MRIAIMGAGVLGVASAYYLAKEGHEIVVVDRQPAPGRETSYANASLLTPNHTFSWAGPGAPWLLVKSLWNHKTGLKLHPHMNGQLLDWGLRFLRNCTAARHRANSLAKARLSFYAMGELEKVGRETGISWHAGSEGVLYLFRDRHEMEHALKTIALVKDAGTELAPISREEIVALEPGLAHMAQEYAGGLRARTDEVGDARRFIETLAEYCRGQGVAFRLNETIERINATDGRVTSIVTKSGEIKADAYVLAAGSYSPHLAKQVGLHLPIYPVKGYSVTMPVGNLDHAPRTGGIDEDSLVTFARIGDKVRMSSVAEVIGYDTTHTPENFRKILSTGRALFRDGINFDQIDYWACLRPATPDGPPIIGPSPVGNLWLNTGHGYLGWTMACGSARLLADMMAGRPAELDTHLYRYGRY